MTAGAVAQHRQCPVDERAKSLSKAAGADHQAVADQLGHTVKVDLAEYSLSPIEDRLEAVEAFEKYVT